MTPQIRPQIRPLTEADIPGALALSAAAHWNQNAADWRGMLALGQGYGLDVGGALAASTVVLPYGERFAWVSMVLVRPDCRQQGLAGDLLRHALKALRAERCAAVLDATPAGHAVYVQEGFVDTWGFARFAREAVPLAGAGIDAARPTRLLCEADWPTVAALDERAFGASRLPVLRWLAQRQPQAARVLEQSGRITGYVLARDGREASQIGPLVAPDEQAASLLLAAALSTLAGPVYIDLLDHRPVVLAQAQALGFVFQRSFTRMVNGQLSGQLSAQLNAQPSAQPSAQLNAAKTAPGDASAVMLVAGPELG